MNYRNTLVCTTVMRPSERSIAVPEETRWLIESANRNGIDVEVIGLDLLYENWWLSKCVRLWESVARRDAYEHIVFVDGLDTLFAAGLDELLAGLEYYDADFLVSGEDICWPYQDLADNPRFDQRQRFRYPNSGFWMATWPAFLREFEKLLSMPHTDRQADHQTIYNCDQGRYELGIADGSLNMAVDVERRSSIALHYLGAGAATSPEIKWGKRPRIRGSKIRPCTIHCNGYAKSALPAVRDLLAG